MAKNSPIKRLVNGAIADANDINQIVESAGAEGGLLPYDNVNYAYDPLGAQSFGSVSYPWGSLFINQNANLVEIEPTNHTSASSVSIKNLRRFSYLKDAPGAGVGPSSYTGNGGKFLQVTSTEDGLKYSIPSNVQLFESSGTFVCPAGITKIYLSMVGGGAGGGGAAGGSNGAGSNACGGGAAAGAHLIRFPYTVVPGNSYTVTVGAAGVHGNGGSFSSNGTDGTAGGNTTFDTITVNGGTQGLFGQYSGAHANAGAGGAATGYSANGTIGGMAVIGVAGGNGAAGGTNGNGGGGGGSPFGKGGTGASTNAAGGNGTGYGAGGGGGNCNGSGQAGTNGGDGTKGVVIIEY